MVVNQTKIKVGPYPRGFHVITDKVLGSIPKITGVVNVFIQHTSASLTINENADPTVRDDFETHFNKMVSEKETHYKHTFEGPDDMTSHIKSSLLGSSVNFPIKGGVPLLGTWQGIYLCEHRNGGRIRKIIITTYGEH